MLSSLLACFGAGPMAVWVCANVSYSVVLKQIAPLESQLSELKKGLADSQDRLSQCQAELGQLDEQVCVLAIVLSCFLWKFVCGIQTSRVSAISVEKGPRKQPGQTEPLSRWAGPCRESSFTRAMGPIPA